MNKKTLAIACCFICLQCCLHAQVMLQSNFPQIGMVQKNQLWSLSIINGSNILYQCKLALVVKNRTTNEEMLVANSALFSLQMGTKQVQLNAVAPISNNYTHPDFNKQNNLLPIGSYTVCYTLDAVAPKEINLANECFQLDIEPLSPPLLSLPADSAILETNANQFTWIPPAPVNLFSNLQYDIVITEVMDGQKATEDIQ